MLFLEQIILKNNAHSDCIKIEACKNGLDFMFNEHRHSWRFVEFLRGIVPIKVKESKKLISTDIHTSHSQ